MNRLLEKGSPYRTALFCALFVAGLLIVTQFILPGSGGGRGTPGAIVAKAVVIGSLNALTAIGIVLIYRTSRIVNFAQAALGLAGAVFTYNFVIVYRLPFGLALAAGVIVSAAIGLASELLLRKFFNAPRLVLTIVTIALARFLAGMPGFVEALPLWGDERGLAERFGGTPIIPLPSIRFTIGKLGLPFGFADILAVAVVFLALLGIGAFFRFTRMGIAVRASSENADRAQLLGINVRSLSTIIWTIAGALSGLGIILFATANRSFAIAGQADIAVLVPALAAAVLARMRSLPVAAVVATGLTLLQSALIWSYQDQQGVVLAAFFVVILVGLILQRKELSRAEEVSSWEATEEVRPTPKEMLTVPGVRLWRWILIGLGAVLVLLLPWISSTGQTNLAGVSAITAIVLLSLVVLTGWAGQVSLGQFAFVAIGAAVGGALTSKLSVPFWVAVPAGAIVTALIAVVVGLPALRIKGLFLGITTFAFAFAVRIVLFDERYFSWLIPDKVDRPTLLLLDFQDERSMYYLTIFFLTLSILLVIGLRRTRPGRVLIALRENANELQAFGVNIVRTKLAAFGIAGFLAGMAGVIFAHHQRAVTDTAFEAQASIDAFVFLVIGGLGSISGAILGAGFEAVERILPNDPSLSFFLNTSVGALVILYIAPGGLSSIMYGLRDSILRIVAQRRQMVVPSLFADYDPSALERRLIPLAEASPSIGLGALGHEQRFQLPSHLYGHSVTAGEGEGRAPDERQALGAAADSLAGEIELEEE